MDHCEECGFDYDLAEALTAGPAIIDGAAELAVLLGSARADLRTRRQSDTWSPLEYGCHLRDVLLVQRERVLAVRRVDLPTFDPMGRDERVDHDGYADQDPVRVARQLTEAAYLYANDLSRLTPEDWERRSAMYNYPTRSERSLRWIAMHTLHEVRHHIRDVHRQLEGQNRVPPGRSRLRKCRSVRFSALSMRAFWAHVLSSATARQRLAFASRPTRERVCLAPHSST